MVRAGRSGHLILAVLGDGKAKSHREIVKARAAIVDELSGGGTH